MKKINLIITGHGLADELEKYFSNKNIKCLFIPNCMGYSAKFHLPEYLGFTETKKCIIAFQSTITQTKAIKRFIIKFFDKKNNGIMFSLNGDIEMDKNLLYVAIVNSGFGEKCADIIRNSAHVGATVIDARGKGINTEELFGIQINSGKDIVFSVMPSELITGVKRKIKYAFNKVDTDVVSFVLPVSDFSKLHCS